MKKIEKESRIPLYYQLMDIIIEMIEAGNLKADDKLPSERELCEKYDISRSTVRQAIQELEREGYIYRIHGKGTFVSPEKFKQDLLKFYSFTEEMKKLGKVPTSKVLDFKIAKCNEKLAQKMRLNVHDEIYVFTRLRLADGEPMMLETSHVPCGRFPGLTKEKLERRPMYDIFSEEYNTTFTFAEEIFQPVITRENEAKLLNYYEGLPSMMIERFTYEKDTVIEYTKSVARGDRFKYRVALKR
ncbi:GntR family transcriptional regulator [Tepidanaerobacter syntrophicus]|uniref:GntR family transcriptional regulator n=1 Tax=Tepidanaerobacter syntrophicus TaxID=224999 RepID=A0A0U9HGQ3_9FIRM|nr:GntR family transcriptional regulator [Tepidanaerobacter syntrophicus]GAQ26009.1 GntR family transcriptional regulator [Tepidanaerobacter syntrophicus]GLI19669.1 GntR family transcriptional regulator [Tepidanaerobacter syntrophicus]HHV83297.1 GntR family transcriptional regulator [Tepidanaerobacter syntrophicus]